MSITVNAILAGSPQAMKKLRIFEGNDLIDAGFNVLAAIVPWSDASTSLGSQATGLILPIILTSMLSAIAGREVVANNTRAQTVF
jgi:hypothetical protein